MATDGSATVLLIEDDDDNRDLVAEVLAEAGYAVVAVANGAEGLRRLAEQPIDLVLTDVGMPGVGGVEVARAARRIAPTVPIVVVTGYTDREDIAAARGREIDAVLVKPVDPDALTRVVSEVLRARPPRG